MSYFFSKIQILTRPRHNDWNTRNNRKQWEFDTLRHFERAQTAQTNFQKRQKMQQMQQMQPIMQPKFEEIIKVDSPQTSFYDSYESYDDNESLVAKHT